MTISARPVLIGSVLAVLLSHGAFAQDSTTHRTIFPTGLTLQAGPGMMAMRDEFISEEKYSGGMPYFTAAWSSMHGTHAFDIALEYRRSSSIKNNNASTTITQFSLRQAFLYPLPRFRLLSRDAYAFLGPSAELFVFLNEARVAVANPNFTESGAALISLGVSSGIILPLGRGFQTEFTLRSNLLSLGIRVVDTEEEDVSPAKLLTPVSGLNAGTRLGIRYRVRRYLSLALSGGLQILSISAWDPLLSVTNDLALGLTVGW